MLIHGDVWQKPTQYCKAIILQLKINKFNYEKITTGKRRKKIGEVSVTSDMQMTPR